MSDKSNKTAMGKAMTIDRDKRMLTAMITTRGVDRDGDIVEPEGLDFTNFNKNPVVLWAHNSSNPPIAKVEKTYVSPQGVLADIIFAETAFAKDIFSLYADGFLNAWSIGFAAIKGHSDPRLDEDGRVQGYNFRKTEMLELSAVPLPANPDALTRSFAGMEKSTLTTFRKCLEMLPEEMKEGATEFAEAVEAEFTRRKHNSVVAETEPSWNSIDSTSLPLVAFAWEANGTDAEEKSTYQYPHHWVKDGDEINEKGIYTVGEMCLHKGGVSSAWSAALIACHTNALQTNVLNHLNQHRKALDSTDKQYYIESSVDGFVMYGVKDFDTLEENESPFEVVTHSLRETAFNKSISERGSKGDVPTHVKFGEKASTGIDFLIVQEKDGEVIEAKVLQIVVTLPSMTSAAVAPFDAEDLEDEDSDDNGRDKPESVEDATSTTDKDQAPEETKGSDTSDSEESGTDVPVVAGKSLEADIIEEMRLRMEQARLNARCLLLNN